jgi:putative sterol carrier protein
MPELADVRKALKNMSSSADMDKLKGMEATILFDISGKDAGVWTVEVHDGEVTVEEGKVGSPEVTVEASSEDLVALIKGDLNPMAAFMQGRLKVKGDMSVAMKMQKLFS